MPTQHRIRLEKDEAPQRSASSAAPAAAPFKPQARRATSLRQAKADPYSLSRPEILSLHRAIGNRAVRALFTRGTRPQAQHPPAGGSANDRQFQRVIEPVDEEEPLDLGDEDARPTGIAHTDYNVTELGYGASFIHRLESSSGNSADLAGLQIHEVIEVGRNDLNLPMPQLGDSACSAEGTIEDTIQTPSGDVHPRVTALRPMALPVVVETPQRLYWRENANDPWTEFARVEISFKIQENPEDETEVEVVTTDNGVEVAEDYDGPDPREE